MPRNSSPRAPDALRGAARAARIVATVALLAGSWAAHGQSAANATAPAAASGLRFTGELGVGAFTAQSPVLGRPTEVQVMPYVYGEYGRFLARVDTFGVKTLPLFNGHLEVLARFSTEGFKADKPALAGVRNRSNPTPVGLGTAQRLPLGMAFLYAFHDPVSGGALLEATLGSRLELGAVKLYPLLGFEHRTREYAQHLYGVSPAEAAAARWSRGYLAAASTATVAGLAASVPIARDWSLEAQWRYQRLDRAITDSPLVSRAGTHRGHAVLAYRFH